MLKFAENPPTLSPRSSTLTELSGRWWVAHTKARFEKALAWDLLRRGIGYFLPLMETARISGGRKRRLLLPLFPSYVFICGTAEDRSTAMRTDRICQTLEVVDQEGLITELAAIEKVLREASLDPYPHPPLGQHCRITDGAFKGVEGIVVRNHGATRIVLKVSVIALGASLEIDSDLIQAVDGDEPGAEPNSEHYSGS